MIENLRREWQEKQIDLKHVQEQILKYGGVLYERANAYLAEERYHGRVSARLKNFHRDLVEPLLKLVKESGFTVEEVGRYLWARHVPERNAQMAKINPAGPADLAGMSDQQAAAELAALRARPNGAALARIAAEVDRLTAATRALLVREGLEEQTTIDAWERTYKKYVPLMRDAEDAHGGTGQGFTVRGSGTPRRA